MRTLYKLTNKRMGKSNNVCLPDGDPIILCENFYEYFDTKIKNIVNNIHCTLTNTLTNTFYFIEEDIKTNVRLSNFKTISCYSIMYFIIALRKSATIDLLRLCLSKSISIEFNS